MNSQFSNRFARPAVLSAAGLLLAQPVAALDLRVSQIEALAESGRYLPDVSDPSFAGVVIADKSRMGTDASRHASEVGEWIYGRDLRPITGVTRVDAYRADHWLRDGFLRLGDPAGRPPRIETNPMQIHAWVGRLNDTGDAAAAVESVRRFDYAIDRDGFVAVVGLDNGDQDGLPELFAHASNAIAVGRADGFHSRGTTRFEGVGRLRPDLVGPLASTSHNVPIVASAAAMLLQEIDRDPTYADAQWPGALKALLMAGAATVEVDEGDDDAAFGAGLVDPIRSFRILSMGRPAAGGSMRVLQPMGWRILSGDGAEDTLRFTVPENTVLENWRMVAVTHRTFEVDLESGRLEFTPVEPALALSLVSRGSGEVIDASRRPADTVQRLAHGDLPAGAYEVTISRAPGSRVALAWTSDPGLVRPQP